jgi:hypothetical protein
LLRRLGHGGIGVGALSPGTTGRIRLDGLERENRIDTFAGPDGMVLLNDQMGCVPFGAAMVTRIRVPAR